MRETLIKLMQDKGGYSSFFSGEFIVTLKTTADLITVVVFLWLKGGQEDMSACLQEV